MKDEEARGEYRQGVKGMWWGRRGREGRSDDNGVKRDRVEFRVQRHRSFHVIKRRVRGGGLLAFWADTIIDETRHDRPTQTGVKPSQGIRR